MNTPLHAPPLLKRLARRRAAVLAVVTTALAICTAGVARPALAADVPVPVVAAENFYGDVVKQIGGAHVDVTSILTNPDQDPHLFEASAKTARALQHARLVVYSGADYDPWMAKLLGASRAPGRTAIVAADLVGKKADDNPHIWYDLRTMPALARAVSAALTAADPAHKSVYDANLATFIESMKPLDAKVAALRAHYQGTPVTATEPVFGYMADALGLDMRNQRFQLATMNDTEASPSDIAAFERDLRERRVRVLIYNSQATEALTRRMLDLAKQSKVPTTSVTETAPPNVSYQQWMLAQLNALDTALAGSGSGATTKTQGTTR
ncbi:MAG TPA: zinc ABC transporter substrate-binding protein [Paraburkholderia sp.]|jgi:zinc/manganese transport system substrate-binding protein|nr:zinc ABC transporter substrate-binding protein [Paraburkholderia sp.]